MSFEFYDMPNGQTIKLDGEIKDAKTEILDDKLVFKFSKSLNLELTSSRVIKVSANDPGGYFKFRFLNSGNKNITDSFFVSYNSNLNSLFVTLEKGQAKASRQNTLSSALEEIEKEQKIGFIERKTINSLENLKALFVSSANGLNFALAMSIVTISFVYGFFHAAGPGHAKVLTTSYFMANGGNYLKSLWFALKLGFFHVLGSFLLVVVSMFVIDIVADFLAVNSMVLTTKISAIMIIFVAIFMFIDKVKSMGKHEHKCGCCKKENEWFIALSAAIIPCPGTILVFLLAFNVGSYFIALISAVFMGLGMTSVIFLAAVFGSKINKLTSKKFKYVKIYVEFLGIWLMLAIGVFMFMISDKLGIL